jgi:hypothetical protein
MRPRARSECLPLSEVLTAFHVLPSHWEGGKKNSPKKMSIAPKPRLYLNRAQPGKQTARCHWCWISELPTTELGVALTLLVTDIYVTLTI